MRFIFALVSAISLAWPLPTGSSVRALVRGTIVIVGISQDEVVIAADSRIFVGDQRSDDACKITVLSPKVIFAAAGYAGEGLRSKPLWSAYEDASQALMMAEQHVKPGDSKISASADEWAVLVRSHLEQMIARNPDALRDSETDEVTTGIFAGTRDDGKPTYAFSILRATRTAFGYGAPIRIEQTKEIVRETEGYELRPFGDPTIWKEVQAGQTERAKQVFSQLELAVKSRPASPVEVIAEKIAEASIQYSGNGKIGGDVDVGAIRKLGALDWIRIKKKCPKTCATVGQPRL